MKNRQRDFCFVQQGIPRFGILVIPRFSIFVIPRFRIFIIPRFKIFVVPRFRIFVISRLSTFVTPRLMIFVIPRFGIFGIPRFRIFVIRLLAYSSFRVLVHSSFRVLVCFSFCSLGYSAISPFRSYIPSNRITLLNSKYRNSHFTRFVNLEALLGICRNLKDKMLSLRRKNFFLKVFIMHR